VCIRLNFSAQNMSRDSKPTASSSASKPEAWDAPAVIGEREAKSPNAESGRDATVDATVVDATVNDKQPAQGSIPTVHDSRLSPPGLALRRLRANAEIKAISQALEWTGWNRRRAAELLSISYRGLLYKIRQYQITSASSSRLSGLPENAKVE
jgi:DNA-binding NtrC family response regulator